MSISILTVVLGGAMLAGQSSAPAWQSDYFQAQKQAVAQKKPVAVVFGSGANGWTKIARDGTPSADVSKILAGQYLCVYIDTATPAGQKVAGEFGIDGTGIVLSDRTGSLQAFWHQGNMANDNLATYLQRYADPQTVVVRTETATSGRTSFYPSTDGTIDWSNTGGGSSYCPSCNNVRGRR